jgi:hypothetical protein
MVQKLDQMMVGWKDNMKESWMDLSDGRYEGWEDGSKKMDQMMVQKMGFR